MQSVIGIDISKDTLDDYRLSDGRHLQVDNDKLGHNALIRWIGQTSTSLIVFEATGAYHRQLEARLTAADLPFAKINPLQARRFAEVTGRLAKTDRVDAIMLAKMGAVLGLERQKPPNEDIIDLREFLTARRALMKDKVAQKTRLQTTTQDLLKRQISARLRQIEAQIAQIDAATSKKVMQNDALSQKLAILVSIPGIAEVTAISMIAEMPELGTLDGKKAASLAGLAPMSQQSGKWRGKEHIQGGRTFLRRAIYMPALVAVQRNIDLRAKYEQLIKAGKPPKLALTAIMRRLVVLANALIRDGRKWSETRT
jgi:transposase